MAFKKKDVFGTSKMLEEHTEYMENVVNGSEDSTPLNENVSKEQTPVAKPNITSNPILGTVFSGMQEANTQAIQTKVPFETKDALSRIVNSVKRSNVYQQASLGWIMKVALMIFVNQHKELAEGIDQKALQKFVEEINGLMS